MHITFNPFKPLLLAGALSLFAACDIYEDGYEFEECMKQYVVFNLSVDRRPAMTRSTWGDTYTEAPNQGADTYINPDRIRVAVFSSATNTYLGEVDKLMAGEDGKFVGDLTPLVESGKVEKNGAYKLMVMSGCRENADDINLSNLSYDLNQLEPVDGAEIPMWGVQEITFDGAQRQEVTQPIDMLRAAAKIRVNFSDAVLAKYSDIKVRMWNYSANGFCVPTGWDNVTATRQLVRDDSFRPYYSTVSAVAHHFTALSGNNTYQTYAAEYNNEASATPTYLEVTLTNNLTAETKTYPIYFCNYNADGKPIPGSEYNIVRNHLYQFNVLGVSEEGIKLNCYVEDWAHNETTDSWSHDFSYPTYTNPLYPSMSHIGDITVSPEMHYDVVDPELGAFKGYFQITKPANQAWTPTLTDASMSEYAITVYRINSGIGTKVYDTRDDVNYPSSNLIAADDWYEIRVFPITSTTPPEGKKVTLGITYRQTWMGIEDRLYLFINGEADDTAWPNSGSDTKFIEIAHKPY